MLGMSEILLGITTGKYKDSINFLFTVVKRYIFKVKLCNSMLNIHSLIAMVKKYTNWKNVPLHIMLVI